MSNKNIVDPETAEKEFNRLLQLWGIEDDIEDLEDDEIKIFGGIKRKLIKNLMHGSMVIEENGIVGYTLQQPKNEAFTKLALKPATGNAYMAMDKYKTHEGIHRLYAYLGSLSGLPVSVFSNMNNLDVNFCINIATLFLITR